jgi:hypothetical protein
MTSAARVLEEIRAIADRQPLQVFRTVSRVVVGPTALTLLGQAAGWRSTQRPGEQLTIFGIPVEVIESAEVDRAWAVLDLAGGAIAEGVIDPA